MRLFLSLFLALPLAATFCTPPAEETGGDEAAPEPAGQNEADIQANIDLGNQWDAAANAGDVESLVSLYTDDAVMMDPDTPAKIGKEAIRTGVQAFYDQVVLETDSAVEEVRLAGEWAFVRGTFNSTATPKAGGAPVQFAGKWVEIRERQDDGSWKISSGIWNSDQPMPDEDE